MGGSAILSSAAAAAPAAAAAGLAVECTALGFRYAERDALRDVTFVIGRGEIFGFLGPNGGGKTTLFKILSTLVPMQSGTARILGRDLRGDTIAVRRALGVVFQRPSLDAKLTVAENLRHHGHLYGITGRRLKDRATAMLKRLALDDRADDLVETLSGGLQRRVELAKALLHEPQLLLLDEPSTGLDPAARREFSNYLAHLRESEGVTIVLTTHYMEEAERCDRIGILHEGALAAIDRPTTLKAEVGGDVVAIQCAAPEVLERKMQQRFKVKGQIVGGVIRVERPRGHEFVRDVVDVFGSEIESVTFGKPTLEDVFVHLTGHQFFADAKGAAERD